MWTNARQRINQLIAALSKRLQLDVRYFLKGGAWLSLPFLVNYGLGLVRTIFFARFTSQEVYGQFGFINSTSSTFDVFTLPGVNTALTETVARGNLGSLAVAAKARARWSLLATLGMAGVALYYAYQGQTHLVLGLLLAGLLSPLISAFQVVQAYYSGRKRFDIVSYLMVAYTILSTASIFLVIWLEKGLVWLVAASSGTQLVLYFILYQRAAAEARHAPQDPEVIRYGRALTWAGAISMLAFEMDGFNLGITTGFAELAIYSIASVFPEAIKNFMKMLTPMAMPKIAENPDKRIYSPHTRHLLLLMTGANILIVAAAMLVIPFIIILLYGENYRASISLFELLMISLAPSLPGYFFTAAFQARKQTRTIYHFNLLYGFLQISTLLLFVPWLGVTGLAISRIITRWVSVFYQWYEVRKL